MLAARRLTPRRRDAAHRGRLGTAGPIDAALGYSSPRLTLWICWSGSGRVLSRQIAEAHGGSLLLENRAIGRGCEARLRLPLQAATSG